MNEKWTEAWKYQEKIAKNFTPSDIPPIENIQDVFDLPSLIPNDFDFSTLSQQAYDKILSMVSTVIN